MQHNPQPGETDGHAQTSCHRGRHRDLRACTLRPDRLDQKDLGAGWIHGSKARQEAQEQENAGDSPLDSSGWREPWAGETGANGTREERWEYGTGR